MENKAEMLQNRLIKYSSEIIKVARTINKDRIGDYLSNQLYRSGISPSLNYAEARSAESRADFIHKMKICLKELRETLVCLKIIEETISIESFDFTSIMKESNELIAVFVKSTYTAANRNKVIDKTT
jgi:four helix bundle protein